jgi:hypothetical protein
MSSNKIKASELKNVIKEIVKGIFKEMSVTGAVGAVQTPHAFSKRNNPDEEVEEELLDEGISDDNDDKTAVKVAFEIWHIVTKVQFVDVNPKTRSKYWKITLPDATYFRWLKLDSRGTWSYVDSRTPRDKDKWLVWNRSGQNIKETVASDGEGYNIPAAFSGKGGSKKAVQGSKSLGYELTPIGKKDMERKGDRLR